MNQSSTVIVEVAPSDDPDEIVYWLKFENESVGRISAPAGLPDQTVRLLALREFDSNRSNQKTTSSPSTREQIAYAEVVVFDDSNSDLFADQHACPRPDLKGGYAA